MKLKPEPTPAQPVSSPTSESVSRLVAERVAERAGVPSIVVDRPLDTMLGYIADSLPKIDRGRRIVSTLPLDDA